MNRCVQQLFLITLVTACSLVFVPSVSAISTPSFPSCPNPGGEVIANYDSGIHGVPGDATAYSGQDVVFKLSDAKVIQCLCPDTGSGVQTLWWKNPGLSENEQSVLLNQGWIRVPNGSLWGLDETEYFAKSSTYNCRSGGVNGTSTSSGSDSGSSSGSSSSSNGVGGIAGTSIGSVLGASTLAATGNWSAILLAFMMSLTAGIFALRLRHNKQ